MDSPEHWHALVIAHYLGAICTRAGITTQAVSLVERAFSEKLGLFLRLDGVETLDHPSIPQLAAYVRHHFRAEDRMQGVAP